ncbi:MAG: hypothetical protein ACFCAD_19980 [Pleurocapsa sp.]
MEKQNMSKTLENMTFEQLSQYMKNNKDNSSEWQEAYNLFVQKSDWRELESLRQRVRLGKKKSSLLKILFPK